MHVMEVLCISVVLASLIQTKLAISDCDFTSITSPSASSLRVKWNSFPGTTNYRLDLRVVNSTTIAPVVVQVSGQTEKLVQGLRPGSVYEVTVKAYQFHYVICASSQISYTVPATSQITLSTAVSSTSIVFEWSTVNGADEYFLVVNGTFHSEFHNISFTTASGQVDGLLPSKTYKCYVTAANAAGLATSSRVRTVTTLVPPPEGISVEGTGQSTARVTWNTVASVLQYQVKITNDGRPGQDAVIQTTSTTTMDLSDLEPCSTYTIAISSMNMFLVPGESANMTHTTSSIPGVVSISGEYSCSNAMVTVTWGQVSGADMYRATAVDNSGAMLNCTSASGQCHISMLQCGTHYNVQVTTISKNCENTSDAIYTFETASCAPTSLSTYRECSSNAIVFSWAPTNDTLYYVAKSLSSTGQVQQCLTLDTSCYFTNTGCGEVYQYTVQSVFSNGQCRSEASDPTETKTAPCLPQNVQTIAQCESNTLNTTWNSAAGALGYFVEALGNQNEGFNCTTNTTSCVMTGLTCGRSLSVWVSAFDNDCITDPVVDVAETGPCTPQNVSAVGCSPDSASLSWLFSIGAVSYIGVARHADGTVRTCNTLATDCVIQGLRCGETYDTFVVSTNFRCNSTESEHVTVETAPCPPANVEAILNCTANEALVNWQSYPQNGSYTVTMEDAAGHLLNCSTSSNSCRFPDLSCGQSYAFTASYHDGRCGSLPSAPVQMDSAPCEPMNVNTVLHCSSNDATVSWDSSVGASAYTVLAQGEGMQDITSCHTSGTSCELSSLACGQVFNITVLAENGVCNSTSQPHDVITTVPCAPANLTGQVDCSSNEAQLRWASGPNAAQYQVRAVGNDGAVLSCNSSTPDCRVSGLVCGQRYNISVSASDGSCDGPSSAALTLDSVPCPPMNIDTNLDCGTSTLTVRWDSNMVPLNYTATTRLVHGTAVSCNTQNNTCDLSGVPCGQQYNVTVTASNGKCSSPVSPVHTIDTTETAPCFPQSLTGHVECGSSTLVASWVPSHGVSRYVAMVTGPGDYSASCSTAAMYCEFDGLQCASRYDIRVTSEEGTCNSTYSPIVTVTTAPCPPSIFNTSLDCDTNSAVITWRPVPHVLNYSINATSMYGHQASCQTSSTSCALMELECGQTYSLVATATGEQCDSRRSVGVNVTTAPCPPDVLMTHYDCTTNTAAIGWTSSSGGDSFVAHMDGGGHTASCSTPGYSCSISGLHCGQTYNLSIKAVANQCNSSYSEPTALQTLPCAPQNVVASLMCEDNMALVSWDPSPTVTSYNVIAVGQDGDARHCSTYDTSCYLQQLPCGQMYNISVTPYSGSCTGHESSAMSLYTANERDTVLHCSSYDATVSWDSSVGASAYTVLAQGEGMQDITSCHTSGTSCELSSLACGQVFNITVLAEDGVCNSTSQPHDVITTVPCAPANLTGQVDCSSNEAQLRWASGPNAAQYHVRAVGNDGAVLSCNSSTPDCRVSGLVCGQRYNISVSASDGSCDGPSSAALTLDSVPCPPMNIDTNLDCGTSTLTVRWDSNMVPLNYTATTRLVHGTAVSCNTQNNTCDLSGVPCGQQYNVTVTASNGKCSSPVSPVHTIDTTETAPCFPQSVTGHVECGSSTLVASWVPSHGVSRYVAMVTGPGDYSASCSTAAMYCEFDGLQCASRYDIRVTSEEGTCNSTYSPIVTVTTAPCPPSIFNTSLDCDTNSAVITWRPVPHVLNYSINATSMYGHQASCQTSSTSCALMELECGQTYSLVATATGEQCDSRRSVGVNVTTAPCPPDVLMTHYDCTTNTAAIGWTSSSGGDSFVAHMDGGGHTASCSTPGYSCSISGLHCGQTYNLSIKAVANQCNSSYSEPTALQTLPCAPQNVVASLMCEDNMALVSWDPSPTVTSYNVIAVGQDGDARHCSTYDTSCYLQQLPCGQMYNISVTPYSGSCTGHESSAMSLYTAPCRPADIAANVDCSTNSANISWHHDDGAMLYIAEVQSEGGHMASCFSNSSSCSVALHCGQTYSASVVAVTDMCNSSQASVQFDSAPCLPGSLAVEMNCTANSVVVGWQGSPGSDLYTALAISNNGHQASCNTTTTSCTIYHLPCGQTYSIAVKTSADNCSFLQGSNYQVQSAPCKPQNISVDLECSSNEVMVRWDHTGPAQTYSVTALGGLNENYTCTSNRTSCSFAELSCGQTYSFTVTSHTEHCESQASHSVELLTAPCVPTHVEASVDCDYNMASISWDGAMGATGYLVRAEGSRGDVTSCNNTDTQCSIADLSCGQDYTVTVMAVLNTCFGPASEPTAFTSAPCPNTDLHAMMDCTSNTAQISWMPGNGALSSMVTVESYHGSHQQNCSTSGSACNITSLQCGESYTVNVTGHSSTCSITAGTQLTVDTAPCAPTHVNMVYLGEANTASVAWVSSGEGVAYYIASAASSDGQRFTCNATGTSCDITGFLCDTEYSLSVTAMREDCSGPPSAVHYFTTAPCAPKAMHAQLLDCQSGDLSVSWQPIAGALSYCAEAVSSDGQILKCNSTTTSCVIPSLECGQIYNVTVFSNGDGYNSSHAVVRQVMTAPCSPSSVSTVVNCSRPAVSVSWDTQGYVGVEYTVTSYGMWGWHAACNSSGSSCELSGLLCGTQYNLTVTARRNNCSSIPSAVHSFTAAPCTPTLTEVSVDCQADSARVTWQAGGAGQEKVYTVSAEDGQGRRLGCNSTQGLSCWVEGLRCGQLYTFSVTAASERCPGAVSNTLQYHSAACPPTDVQTVVCCYNSSVNVSWSHGNGALSYVATLESQSGETSVCISNSTGCDITNLPCGQTYNVTVAAEGQTCNSSVAVGSPVKTAPCAPQNLMANVSCSSDTATVTWDSSHGAELYQVVAMGNGHEANCTTSSTSCDLPTLRCGQSYWVTAVGMDSNCFSSHSVATQLHTAPCPPERVGSTLDCSSNTLTVSWSQSTGGDNYVATLWDADGLSMQCQSVGTQCNVTNLRCGQVYHVSVTASNAHCTSPPSAHLDTHSVPCLPKSIESVMDCQLGTAMVSWNSSAGAQAYTVTALAPRSHNASCNTSSTNCELSMLGCGEEYSVSVQAHGPMCSSGAVMTSSLITEPCIPQHLSVQYSLSIAQLSWDSTKGAVDFTAEAVTEEGLNITCMTTDTNCALIGMECGQIYNITVTASNQACQDSVTSDIYQLLTEPCPPQNVQASFDCATLTAHVTWEGGLTAEGYAVSLEGRNGHSASCLTQDTHCSVPALMCGTVYYIRVIATAEMFNSSDSATINLTSAPCMPDSVAAEVDCELDSALVSWNLSNGAENYTVTALGNSGQQLRCSTEQNHCNVSTLQCGETYNLTLTSVNHQCEVTMETNVSIQSQPCPPTAISATVDCVSSIAAVSWAAALGSEYYIATFWGATHQWQTCMSEGTHCGVPALACGQNYTVTVASANQQCNSSRSAPADVHTVPCVPTDVAVVMECEQNAAVVSWSHSQGALSYHVHAQSSNGNTSCHSTEPTCTLTNLTCGTSYITQVVAMDNNCSSAPSQPAVFQSVPCRPSAPLTSVDCQMNTVLLEWDSSEDATLYTAIAHTESANLTLCSTNHTSCEVMDMPCGHIYTVTMTASNGQCSSPPSEIREIASVPCAPQNVLSVVTCSSDSGLVRWDSSAGADSYVVTGVGTQGHVANCSTSALECQLEDLRCSDVYNISVVAVNVHCNISGNTTAQIRTAPCVPANVQGSVACRSGAVSVSWDHSARAASYLVVAHGNGGYGSSCNSSETVCEFSDLLCGMTYSLEVSASDGTCSSAVSGAVTISTVACEPQNATAELDCATNVAVVTWDPSDDGAVHVVVASGPDGHRALCNSTTDSCLLPDMRCGQLYNLTVTALDGVCDSSHSQLTLQSAPCAPGNVQASLQCESNTAYVWWELAAGAESYSAIGRSADGHAVSCDSSGFHCYLQGLQCGQNYNLSVRALDNGCHSMESSGPQIQTAPCPPENIATQMDCESGTMLVRWDSTQEAESFWVEALTENGTVHACNTTDMYCSVSGLACGQELTVKVMSFRGECQSKPSPAHNTSTAPCTPEGVMGSLDCVTNSVWVSWDMGMDQGSILSYTAIGISEDGHNSSCTSSNSTCEVPDLGCGARYTFHVTSTNGACQSPPSSSFQIDTAPCALSSVWADSECHSGTIRVHWEAAETGQSEYTVTAEAHDRSILTCNSAASSCNLTPAQCGMKYTVVVSASSDQCSGLRSPPYRITTEPCQPPPVAVSALCETEGVSVSWQPSLVAEWYLLTATAPDEDVHTCNTSLTSCVLTSLNCSQEYQLSVTSSHENCSSLGSPAVTFNSVPCVPELVSVDMQCGGGQAVLGWAEQPGAVEYVACAQAENESLQCCESAGLNCTLEDLLCGELYNYSVLASDGQCNSSFSQPLQQGSVPCSPAGLQFQGFQQKNGRQVFRASWNPVDCPDVEYQLQANGSVQGHPQALFDLESYWTEMTYFEMPLPCGSPYSVTVKGRHSAGMGSPSDVVTGVTAPCPPVAVTFTGSSASAVVSWNASVFSTEYRVHETVGQNRTELCNTTQLSCSISNAIGENITVTALNSGGESEDAAVTLALPGLVVRVAAVTADSMWVEWNPLKGAKYYTVLIQEQSDTRLPRPLLITVYGEASNMSDLRPATTYCITVTAKTHTPTSSSTSQTICVQTAAQI